MALEPGTSTVRSGACRLSVTPCGLLKWMQGWESHPPSPAYETGQSTGSPCIWKMKPWSACDDTTYPPNLWRSDPLSCLAWHTSSMKMARRVGIAPTSAGFGGPCIACLPPPFLSWMILLSNHERTQRPSLTIDHRTSMISTYPTS